MCDQRTAASVRGCAEQVKPSLSSSLCPSMIDTTMPRDCQAERPRKGYTYLHLTAARMHDLPPGLPLLQPLCMHWTYLFIASEIQNQHPLRAGRTRSILTSPDTRMHVGEMSVSAHARRGRQGRFTTASSFAYRQTESTVLPYVKSSISMEQLTLCSNLKESGIRHEPWKKATLMTPQNHHLFYPPVP